MVSFRRQPTIHEVANAKICVHMLTRRLQSFILHNNLRRFCAFTFLYIAIALQSRAPAEAHTTLQLYQHAAETTVETPWESVRELAEARRWLHDELPRALGELQRTCPSCELALARRPASLACATEPFSAECAPRLVCSHGLPQNHCDSFRRRRGAGRALAIDKGPSHDDDDGGRALEAEAEPPAPAELGATRADHASDHLLDEGGGYLAAVWITRGDYALVIEHHAEMVAADWSEVCRPQLRIWTSDESWNSVASVSPARLLLLGLFLTMAARMLLSETREVSLAWEQGADGMVAYFGNAWNWVDWVNLGLPLAKFLSDAAARLLGFQMLPTRWAHALWGFMTVTLALRFFRYASCLSQFKLIFNTLQRAARGIRNFLTTAAAILSFLAVAGHMMFGHFSPRFRSLLTSLYTTSDIMLSSLFEIPDEIVAVTPVLGYLFYYLSTTVLIVITSQLLIAIILQAFDDVRTDMSHDSFIDRDGEVLEALKGWRKIAAPAGTSAGLGRLNAGLRNLICDHSLPGIGGMATADLLEALMLVAEEDDETELRELMVGAEQLRRRLRQVGPGLEEHAEAVLAQFGMVEEEAAPAGRRISLHALEMRNAAIAQTRELLNHNKLGGLSSRRIRTPSSEKSHRRASAPTSAVSEEEAEEGVVRRNSTEATFHRSAGATLMR